MHLTRVSFLRKQESQGIHWIPAFAGMTACIVAFALFSISLYRHVARQEVWRAPRDDYKDLLVIVK